MGYTYNEAAAFLPYDAKATSAPTADLSGLLNLACGAQGEMK